MNNLINFGHQHLRANLLIIGVIFVIIVGVVVEQQHCLFGIIPALSSLSYGFKNILFHRVVDTFKGWFLSMGLLDTRLSFNNSWFFRNLIWKLSTVCFLSVISDKIHSFWITLRWFCQRSWLLSYLQSWWRLKYRTVIT